MAAPVDLAGSARGASGAQFRKVLTVASGTTVGTALAKITADRTYRFWVNGRLVSRGRDDLGFDVILSQNWTHQWLYNQVDVGPYLHTWENVLAVEVLTQNSPGYSLKHSGFAFDLSATTNAGATLHVQSDATWAAQPLNAYTTGPITEGSIQQSPGSRRKPCYSTMRAWTLPPGEKPAPLCAGRMPFRFPPFGVLSWRAASRRRWKSSTRCRPLRALPEQSPS